MSSRRFLPAGFLCRASAAALASCFLISATARGEGLPDLGEASQEYLPPALEKRIGQTAANEYRESSNYIDDAEITNYITKLGMRLAMYSEERQDFEFFVLRDSTLNAFAMPGGYIGVHSGLIVAAQSESELAGVLGHEISHVTQRHLARLFSKQSQSQIPTLVAMAVALLAARSNPNAGMGGMVAAQAFGIQNYLSYSRDFEREADRLGISLLEKAGFDVHGMEAFFERMLKYGRLYESNAPGYLRTHPLTTERISDMANRAQGRPYKQVRDSFEFLLVRAKLRATDGSAREAVQEFTDVLREQRYTSESATRYGMAVAQLRARNTAAAAEQLAELRKAKANSYMIESLAAQIQEAQGDPTGAEQTLRAAMIKYPQERPLHYSVAQTLMRAGKPDEALRQIAFDQQFWPGDVQLYLLQSQAYAAQGKQLQQHKSRAEAFALRGQLMPAIMQLQIAQKAPDGNFFEYSQIDARLRELKEQKAAEDKDKDKFK